MVTILLMEEVKLSAQFWAHGGDLTMHLLDSYLLCLPRSALPERA